MGPYLVGQPPMGLCPRHIAVAIAEKLLFKMKIRPPPTTTI
jgi:hypothetical protein